MEESSDLPHKLFYKIGEVARLVGVEPHVLRYWEKEFSAVRPRKSRGGQRLYRRNDLEALLRIKELLKDQGFTISGARRQLTAERRHKAGEAPAEPQAEGDAGDEAGPPPLDEAAQRLMDELERLKVDCQELRQSRAVAVRRLAAAEESLRQVRRELETLLDEVDHRQVGMPR